MIETLSLRNFKVLREVDARLQPLTLVVGPNGSGKSSFLSALNLGLDCLAGRSINLPIHRSEQGEDLRSRVSKGPWFFHLALKEGLELTIVDQKAEIQGDLGMLRAGALESAFIDIDARKLANPSPSQKILQNLPSDGTGLAWYLARLQLEFPDRFGEIVERLRDVVPAVRRLRIKTVDLPEGIGFSILFDMTEGDGISASSVSEGTLITLALLVVLSSPTPPALILIENLERGLHPKALGNLVSQIRTLQSRSTELQIVATSHSPYLLDYLEANEVLLTSPDVDGYSSVKALSQHPDYQRWKDVMAPGEFWSTVGESWVVQKS